MTMMTEKNYNTCSAGRTSYIDEYTQDCGIKCAFVIFMAVPLESLSDEQKLNIQP